jgi:hypothetical protein
MFEIESDNIRKLERDLETFAARSLPFATRKTLNDAAFAAQKIARADVRTSMVNRNRFTEQSIRTEQAKTLNIRNQASIVGSIAEYMEDQEFGATKGKRGRHGVAIATSYAAGQGENAQPRTRFPRKANSMPNIQLKNRRRKGTKKQRNIIAIKQAAESGQKFVFLDLGRTKGIFRVVGGKRRPKIKMVYSLSRESVVIPRNPWLKPSFEEATRMIPAFYADALRFQLRRQNLLS